MRVTFVSNYFSHHQQPLSDVLFQLTGGNYRFIATERIPLERSTLGWRMDGVPDYVSEALGGNLSADDADWLQATDVLLFGSAPEALLKTYLADGGLAFRYSERPLKDGDSLLKRIPRWVRWHLRNPSKARLYLLSAGAFAASDYGSYGLFRTRSYKWGYFPPLSVCDSAADTIASKLPASLFWCGRFLDWKHPDLALGAAALLNDAGYDMRLTMVGAGPMELELRQMVEDLQLHGKVEILPPRSNEAVRNLMQQHQVFLFTSDRREGWGAVLNEAMNGACAVVASGVAGSTPYLVRHGQNGLVCDDLSALTIAHQAAQLLDDKALRDRLSIEAYRTIASVWNAQVAGRRLMELSAAIMNGEVAPDLFEDGPCSKAE